MSASNAHLLNAIVLSLIMSGAGVTAYAQQTRDRRPVESTPPVAQPSRPPIARYDLGIISKKIAALEGQVAELKKNNAELANQIAEMKLKAALAKGVPSAAGTSVPERLKKLEDTLRTHTHYMPNIGIMALNALPGMQEIANKSGVGHVIEQWKGIKMHVSFGAGGGLDRTGLPIPSGQ